MSLILHLQSIFKQKAEQIKQKAEHIYNKFKVRRLLTTEFLIKKFPFNVFLDELMSHEILSTGHVHHIRRTDFLAVIL